jgi:V-type H+-transporting ATPase subunit E
MLSDSGAYQRVLKELIIQCLIKLLENNVEIMCREDDQGLVQAAMDEA